MLYISVLINILYMCVYSSAVQTINSRLIAFKIKCFVYILYVCTVYIYVYINTQIYSIYFEMYLHVYIYIHIINIIYKYI